MRRRHVPFAVTITAALLTSLAGPADAQLARELGLLPPESAAAARIPALPTESAFALDQMRNERVLDARVATRFNLKRLFHEQGIRYPAAEVFMRIFKRERSLEVWVRPTGGEQFALLKTYPICALAGELGPKRRQGDAQVPEGFYHVDFFNPRSEYHLSLHVDYPNQHDRITGVAPDLGGDIYIHGGCNSEGCLALTDDGIKEVYWLAVEARSAGQQRIPVHIFPARLETEELTLLQRAFAKQPELGRFWSSLKPGYDYFEEHRRIPAIAVDARGDYRVNGESAEPIGAPVPDAAAKTGAKAKPAAKPGTKPKPVPLGTPVGGSGG